MNKPIEIQIQNADPNKISIGGAVKNLKVEFGAILEMQHLQGKIKYAYYEGLIEAGFTEEQAMFLSK